MKNKELLKIIIVITIVLLGLVLIVKRGTKYNKLIINEDKWNDIIESRKESLDHLIDKITFNEHKLILDDESNTLYYSMIDNKSSYNPKVFTRNKVSLATKEKIDDDGIKNNHLYELLVYDDTEYEIYNINIVIIRVRIFQSISIYLITIPIILKELLHPRDIYQKMKIIIHFL